MQSIKMEFTEAELIEIEDALEFHDPSDCDDAVTTHRLFYRVGKALGRPWTMRFDSEDAAVAEHMSRRVRTA
jgi:hypothetical protein